MHIDFTSHIFLSPYPPIYIIYISTYLLSIHLNFYIRCFLSGLIESENTNVYTLEMSMFGYKPDSAKDDIHQYTEENCNNNNNNNSNRILSFQIFCKAAVSAEHYGIIIRSQAMCLAVRC